MGLRHILPVPEPGQLGLTLVRLKAGGLGAAESFGAIQNNVGKIVPKNGYYMHWHNILDESNK